MSKTRKPSVGVIGLGSMGMGVARTLVSKGFPTHAFDIRARARNAFAKAGGTAHRNPAEMAAECDIVIVLVVNAKQTSDVLFGKHGAAAAMKSGGVVIASATVAPDFAASLGEYLDSHGLLMIDAPGRSRRCGTASRDGVKSQDDQSVACRRAHRLGMRGDRTGHSQRC